MIPKPLKRWQWAATGILGGMLIGIVQLTLSGHDALGGAGYVTLRQFIDILNSPSAGGESNVVGVTVQPAKDVEGVDLVKFRVRQASGDFRTYKFAAPRPFSPSGSIPPREDYTVTSYLDGLAAHNPAVRPRSSLEDSWATILGSYMLVGLVLLGGIWPAIAKRLMPSCLDVSPGPVSLPRGSDAQLTPTITPAIDQTVEDLEREIKATLGKLSNEPRNEESHSAAPVCQLDTSPDSESKAPPKAGPKSYAGSYYPVEVTAPHAFTLVELLVTIGIVTLLASFLLPALSRARQQAKATKCAAQLRDIGQALHAYASNNHGWLPAFSDWHTWPPGLKSDTYGPAWTIELIPYIGKPDSPIYNCPSFPLGERYRNYFLETQWAGLSAREAMRLSDVKMFGRFVLSGDTTSMKHYTADVRLDDADPDDYGGGMLLWPWDGSPYMHLGGNNVLFDDGHVALFSRYDPQQMTFSPRRMQDHNAVTPD